MSIRSIGMRMASLKLRFDEMRCGSVEDYLKLVRGWSLLGRTRLGLQQLDEEILQLLSLLRELQPKSLLEIGTAGGGTLYLFCKVAAANAVILSIDLQHGPFGGGYPPERSSLYKSFARHQQKILLFQADSHAPGTLNEVKNLIGKDPIDFLFIDGDHRYEGVEKDFSMYSPFVRKGGLVALHDIAPNPPDPNYGVRRFWNEVKASYRNTEILRDPDQVGYGIGVLFMSNA